MIYLCIYELFYVADDYDKVRKVSETKRFSVPTHGDSVIDSSSQSVDNNSQNGDNSVPYQDSQDHDNIDGILDNNFNDDDVENIQAVKKKRKKDLEIKKRIRKVWMIKFYKII